MEQCCDFGPAVPVLLDEEGYAVSFAVTEKVNAQAFLEKNGFVVIRDVVADEATLESIKRELWSAGGLDGAPENLELLDWNDFYGSKYNTGKGFVGGSPAIGPAAIKLREDPALVGLYQHLLGSTAIWAKFDRFGFMRPTKTHPEWATETGFVHWDQNPTVEPNFARLQGVVALSNHSSTSGGFHCIPEFQNGHFHQWAQKHPQTEDDGDLIDVAESCLRSNHAKKVPMRAGSMVIWDSRTPHGNWPNEQSDEIRQVLYLTYFPAPTDRLVRCHIQNRASRYSFVPKLSPLGRLIYAVEPYSEEQLNAPCKVDRNSFFSGQQSGYA